MNVARKFELIKSAIDSLTTHEDTDAAVRKAGLDAVIAHCEAAKTAIDAGTTSAATLAFGQ